MTCLCELYIRTIGENIIYLLPATEQFCSLICRTQFSTLDAKTLILRSLRKSAKQVIRQTGYFTLQTNGHLLDLNWLFCF